MKIHISDQKVLSSRVVPVVVDFVSMRGVSVLNQSGLCAAKS